MTSEEGPAVADTATAGELVPRGTWRGQRGAGVRLTLLFMPVRTPRLDPRLRQARQLAVSSGGVLSRRQLYAIGVTRWEIRGEVKAGRWQLLSDQAVCLHNGPVADSGHRWAAVIQGGPRACLDGVAALQASGLERYDEPRIRVSVPPGARVRRSRHYDIRQTRRWRAADLAPAGIPRTRVEVAAVRAALWARSDRQAAYLLTLVVQQGMTTAEALGTALLAVRRDRRRPLLHSVVLDLLGGGRSLGELDVAAQLRRRGLPEPERQVLRRDRRNRYYLDLCWPTWHLVVEVDGIQHAWAENVVGDALRQNSLALDGDTVLRLPLLGLRLAGDEFYDQIEAALRRAGWEPEPSDVMRPEQPLTPSA